MTYLKYLIIKFRQKISYLAFKKKSTIMELFLNAIKKSHNQLRAEGVIQVCAQTKAGEDALYNMVISEHYNLSETMSSINKQRLLQESHSHGGKSRNDAKSQYDDVE